MANGQMQTYNVWEIYVYNGKTASLKIPEVKGVDEITKK